MKGEESISFAFETMKMKLEHFFDAANVLDQKISTLVGFLGVIITAFIGFFQDDLQLSLQPLDTNPFSIGIGFLVLALFLNSLALTIQEYSYPPNDEVLFSEDALNSELIDFKNQMTADLKEGLNRNIKIQKYKAKLFDAGLWFAFLGILMVFVNFFMV